MSSIVALEEDFASITMNDYPYHKHPDGHWYHGYLPRYCYTCEPYQNNQAVVPSPVDSAYYSQASASPVSDYPAYQHVRVNPRTVDVGGYIEADNEPLGKGSCGVVHKVYHYSRQQEGDPTYARKTLSLGGTTESAFAREVNTTMRAEHHHVVKIIDHYSIEEEEEEDRIYYIVMSPVADGDLKAYLKTVADYTSTYGQVYGTHRWQLFQWIYCLASTMEILHSRQIQHRDITPRNILTHGYNILLTDFGLELTSEKTQRFSKTNTNGPPRYEPPEQLLEGGRPGLPADIFSLGGVFLDMVQAASNLDDIKVMIYSTSCYDEEFRHRVAAAREADDLIQGLPKEYRYEGLTQKVLEIVLRMLSYYPEDRPTARQVLKDLRHVYRKLRPPFHLYCGGGKTGTCS